MKSIKTFKYALGRQPFKSLPYLALKEGVLRTTGRADTGFAPKLDLVAALAYLLTPAHVGPSRICVAIGHNSGEVASNIELPKGESGQWEKCGMCKPPFPPLSVSPLSAPPCST